MALKRIRAYFTSKDIRAMGEDSENYYTAESVIAPTVMYVLDPEEIIIVTETVTIRIPKAFVEELGVMLSYIDDPDNKSMLMSKRIRREYGRHDQKTFKRTRSCDRGRVGQGEISEW